MQADKIANILHEWQKNKDDMMREIADEVRDYMVNLFLQRKGEKDGSVYDWANKKDGTPATLQKEGKLLQSLKDSIKSIETDKIVFAIAEQVYSNGKTTLDVASYHKEGTKHLPQRNFFQPSENMMRKIEEVIDKWVDKL